MTNEGQLGEILDYQQRLVELPQDLMSAPPAAILVEWLQRRFRAVPGFLCRNVVLPYMENREFSGWGTRYSHNDEIDRRRMVEVGRSLMELMVAGVDIYNHPDLIDEIPQEQKLLFHLMPEELDARAKGIIAGIDEGSRMVLEARIENIERTYGQLPDISGIEVERNLFWGEE